MTLPIHSAKIAFVAILALLIGILAAGTNFAASGTASASTPPVAPTHAKVTVAPTNVPGSPPSVGMGFNNSEQIVDAGDGTQMVWTDGGDVVLATRSSSGAITAAKTVQGGISATLPVIARGNRLAVGWTSRKAVYATVSPDGGTTFGEVVNLGSGTGLSLAASGDRLVAVWHTGGHKATTSQVLFRSFDGKVWSEPKRIDNSIAAPLWASVAVNGDRVFVAWRDNSTGIYLVTGRSSKDGGKTWGSEMSLATKLTGDPDVCVTDSGEVWVAHHGRAKISLLHSADGATFDPPIAVGNGYFAHVSCNDAVVGVAWLETTGSHTSTDKKAGYAVYQYDGTKITSGIIDEGEIGAATIHASASGSVEILWLKPGSAPLKGSLRHQKLVLQ